MTTALDPTLPLGFLITVYGAPIENRLVTFTDHTRADLSVVHKSKTTIAISLAFDSPIKGMVVLKRGGNEIVMTREKSGKLFRCTTVNFLSFESPLIRIMKRRPAKRTA